MLSLVGLNSRSINSVKSVFDGDLVPGKEQSGPGGETSYCQRSYCSVNRSAGMSDSQLALIQQVTRRIEATISGES